MFWLTIGVFIYKHIASSLKSIVHNVRHFVNRLSDIISDRKCGLGRAKRAAYQQGRLTKEPVGLWIKDKRACRLIDRLIRGL